jgi:hypothetical protein
MGGLADRAGNTWMVFDSDGTREAARQRAWPQTDELPRPFRRLDVVCAPGNPRRKRGEGVRTRPTVSQAHRYQWLGSFGNRGNGCYREELRQALSTRGRSLVPHQLSPERTLLHIFGQEGNGAVLSDVAGFAFVTRGKDSHLLDHPLMRGTLALAARSGEASSRKSDDAQPLRLPRDPSGARGSTLPRDRGHASCREEEESSGRHTCRSRLRTVRNAPAATRLHGLRYRRTVPASWRL